METEKLLEQIEALKYVDVHSDMRRGYNKALEIVKKIIEEGVVNSDK